MLGISRHWVFALMSLCLSVGCQKAASSKGNTGGTGSHISHVGGSPPGTGGSSALPSQSLNLTNATVHVDGRLGSRFRLTVSGEQTAGTFASVAVTALDRDGNCLAWFDADHDSTLESCTGFLVPQGIPNEATFTFDIIIPLSSELLDWTQAKVSLYDRADAVSNELTVEVQQQPERTSGQACDPTAEADRCATGLECSASTNTCVNHTGPSLSKVAYLTTSNGPVMLATGLDNADDVIEMDIGFFDSNGASVQVDVNNDPDHPLMVSTFTESGGITSSDGVFAFQINPSVLFTETVKSISFVPVQRGKQEGLVSDCISGPATFCRQRCPLQCPGAQLLRRHRRVHARNLGCNQYLSTRGFSTIGGMQSSAGR